MLTIFISQAQSSWQIVNSPVNVDFVSVCFTDEAHGWIISKNGTLIKTTDGGITWTTFLPFPGFHLNSIYFSDDNHGCSVGWWEGVADGAFFLTNNGEPLVGR